MLSRIVQANHCIIPAGYAASECGFPQLKFDTQASPQPSPSGEGSQKLIGTETVLVARCRLFFHSSEKEGCKISEAAIRLTAE